MNEFENLPLVGSRADIHKWGVHVLTPAGE